MSSSRRTLAVGLIVSAMLTLELGCAALRKDPQPEALGVKETSPAPQQSTGAKLDGRIAYETAKLAEQRGMDHEAIVNFEKARSYDPQLEGIAHSLAVLYDRAGRVDAAAREYGNALMEDTDNADVHCDYGYFLYSTQRPQEAEVHLRKALAISPQHRQAQVNLGLLLGTSGNFEEAQQLFTAAIGPAAAQHNIGMLKIRRGDVASGREHLRIAAESDPSLDRTQAVLASLSDPPLRR